MATRLLAAGLLIGSGLVAWLAIVSTLVARLLQAVIAVSMLYVGYLAFRGWRFIVRSMAAASTAEDLDGSGADAAWPTISVVVPARDEASVIGGVVADLVAQRYGTAPARGAAAVSWPTPEGYEVVVLDDGSTDGTGAAASAAAGAASDGLVRVVRREEDAGPRTKGAALAAAMPHLAGELVVVLDADSRIADDFLCGLVRAWRRDPGAAAFQVRRDPVNRRTSWLTAAQGEELVMDLASQCGRRTTDGTAELRGNGMALRRDALEALGGWAPGAITEDLELSTRIAASGAHVGLAPEVTVGEEAVETIGALWRQRLRWAEGSIRRLMEHGPGLLLGRVPLSRKLDFLAFATEFAIPPLFATSIVASLITIPLPVRMDWTVPASLFAGYGLGSFLLALAGLAGTGERGWSLLGRATRGALFLSHWLLVVPVVLARIAVAPPTSTFSKTPRVRRGSA